MIHQEQIEIGDKHMLKTYSDEYFIRQVETGNVYAEAIDVIPCQYTYVETNEEKEAYEREHSPEVDPRTSATTSPTA